MNLLTEHVLRKTRDNAKNNPNEPALKAKIFALRSLGGLKQIDCLEKLQNYVNKCLSIARPEDSPKIFVCGNEADFNSLCTQIKSWEIAKNCLVSSSVMSAQAKDNALNETFFFDSEKLEHFKPSDYFVLINPNDAVIGQIEARASTVSSRSVAFDEAAKTTTLPRAGDPFALEVVDPSDGMQVLVGDKIMYPFFDETGKICIKLLKITY